MSKKNTYRVPINLIKKLGLTIEAESQLDAEAQVEEFLERNVESLKGYEVDYNKGKITCDQDDEIINEIAEDFGIKVEEYSGTDYFTGESIMSEGFVHQIAIDNINPILK